MSTKAACCKAVLISFLLALGVCGPQTVSRASTDWSIQFGCGGNETVGGIACDTSGNVYVAGSTTGNFYTTNAGGEDLFLAKYDASGKFVWGKQLGTTGDEDVSDMVLDASGNIYLVGQTSGNLFGTNGGQGNPNTVPNDAYIVKFNSAGTQLWGKQFGTNTSDGASSLALDSQGNLIVAGTTDGSLFGTNAGYENDPTLARGTEDIFLMKYDQDGNVLWSTQFGSPGDDFGGIALDSQNNIILAGTTYEMFAAPLSDPAGADSHALLAKLYSSGNLLLWGKQINGSNAAQSGQQNSNYDAPVVDSGNNIITAGSINVGDSTLTNQEYLVKYNQNGTLLWENLLTSYSSTGAIEGLVVSGLATDSAGDIIADGYTYGSLFAPNSGERDIFVAKYNPSGGLIWGKQYGTLAEDEADADCVDSSGNVYVAGITSGSLFTPEGNWTDVFIQKITPTGQMALAKLNRPSSYKPLLFAWSGQSITLSYPPVLANHRPYLYAGYLCSGIPNAKVHQNAAKQVVVEGPSKQVIITPNALLYRINGKPHTMSAKPVMVGNRCYVPLDVMKAVLPYPVHYEAKAQTVHFDPPQRKTARR